MNFEKSSNGKGQKNEQKNEPNHFTCLNVKKKTIEAELFDDRHSMWAEI